MRPLKNYVLVVDAGEEDVKTTAGGIILQQVIEKGSKPGLVLAVGVEENAIKPKDKVALDWSKSMPVTVQGEKAVLINSNFIYAIY
jgi:co-chaperonin GroES (HSP10)|tara:strand:- start:2715 stop:2972 length:258 start_codon:yes stop_codon:yes gene_type:complete